MLQELARNGSLAESLWNSTTRAQEKQANGEHVSDEVLGGIITPSRMAVIRSHQQAQKAFLASDHDVGLFLEDDIALNEALLVQRPLGRAENAVRPAATLPRHAQQRFHEALVTRRDSWELLYLGYCWEHCTPRATSSAAVMQWGGYLRDAVQPMCLHAFASKRDASKRLLQALAKPTAPVDMVWAKKLVRSRKIRAKILVPPLFVQARRAVRTRNGVEAEHERALVSFQPLECLPDGHVNTTHMRVRHKSQQGTPPSASTQSATNTHLLHATPR